uniref:Uncharacterized protein n=1 Tax=Pithovirus LCDPAC02 TaxID=2506601 RepID=A0A481YNH1_9VIRU|nr:MAG: hypothetical protein LCDPAC02_00200 [Pithovirus LCDPAC02]
MSKNSKEIIILYNMLNKIIILYKEDFCDNTYIDFKIYSSLKTNLSICKIFTNIMLELYSNDDLIKYAQLNCYNTLFIKITDHKNLLKYLDQLIKEI